MNKFSHTLINKTISLSDNKYKIIAQLDEGTYGQVFEAKCLKTQEIVVAKIINCDSKDVPNGLKGHKERSGLMELGFLKKFDHPNVIKLKDFGCLIKGNCK